MGSSLGWRFSSTAMLLKKSGDLLLTELQFPGVQHLATETLLYALFS